MALKLKSISIGERDELEPILIENPSVIEEGLRIITHQQMTNTGPLDILAVDAEKTLVVIELKNEAAEGHIDQGLRYYDWCRQNLAWLTQAFSDFEINPKALPRLFLIAPTYTDTVKQIAKYVAIGVDLRLFEYHALENEKGEHGVICREIDFGLPPEQPKIMSLADKVKYFEDAKVKKLFEDILGELQKQGVEVKPVSNLAITLWYNGKRFIWMAPRKKHFVVNVLSTNGGWTGGETIHSRKDWSRVYNSQIKKYLEYLDANAI